jgi:hypothetical protein
MTVHEPRSLDRSTTWLPALLATAALGIGCADQARSDSASGAYQELGVQLQNCANDAITCLGAANCDDAAEQACREQFHTCREGTRAAYRTFFEAVGQCWSTKRECVAGARDAAIANDGGARSGHAACRDAFHACVDDNRPVRPGPGPCMQGLRECVQTDVQSGRRERRHMIHDCLGEAHQCILDRLPMCDPTEPPAGGTGTTSDAGS